MLKSKQRNEWCRMGKILLLSVICEGMWSNQEELGIASIASCLREHGYEVMLKKVNADSIDYEEIKSWNPTLVGIPVYDINKMKVYEVFQQLKGMLPNTVTSVGGAFVTFCGREVLSECKEIDVVIIGEGEHTLCEFMSVVDKEPEWESVQGIMYRQGSQIKQTQQRPLIQSLESLPLPARDILIQDRMKVAQVSSSRGCTANCSFCVSGAFWKGWRGRDTENVIDEIQSIVETYGVRAFNVIDGSFEDPGFCYERILKLAQGIIARKLKIVYYVQMRAESCRKLSEEMIEVMKESGLSAVCIGIEAGNEADLKLYQKRASLADMTKALEFFQRHDIYVDIGFINFNPYTSFKHLRNNLELLRNYGYASNPEYLLRHSKIYPGTSLYERVKENQLLCDDKIGWHFQEQRIRQFFDYVCAALRKKKNFSTSEYRSIAHGTTINNVYLSCLKTLLINTLHKEALSIVCEYEKNVHSICEDLNHTLSSWFLALIQLGEQGWNEEKAKQITDSYLTASYLSNASLQFRYHTEKMKLALERQSIEKEYLDFIYYVF